MEKNASGRNVEKQVGLEMKKGKHASGEEGLVHQYNTRSKNQGCNKVNCKPAWKRKPKKGDHTAKEFVRLHSRSSKFKPQEFPQYGSGVLPFSVHVNGTHGIPSYGCATHADPLHVFGIHYPPFFGVGVPGPLYGVEGPCPPYDIGTPCPPPHGVPAPDPLYHGVPAPAPLSRGVAADNLPSQGFGATNPPVKFPVVSVRGLPVNCREIDIIQFFKGFDIVDVVPVFTNKTFSGEAFVVFSSSAFADYAIQGEKQKLGNADVEVLACRRHDYYVAVAANEGVDLSNSEAHTKNSSNNYLVQHTHSGKSDVVAEVKYPESPRSQEKCLSDNNMVTNTHKPRSDAEGVSKLLKQLEGEAKGLLNKDQAKQNRIIAGEAKSLFDTNHPILKVCGPPYFADTNVIIGVFGECDLSEDRVHNVLHPNGKPIGEMFLEFISEEDAKKALSKNKTMIGSHVIEIVPATMEDLRIENTELMKLSDKHDRLKESSDEKPMEPDSHSHGKPERSADEERKVDTKIIKMCNVPPSADMYEIIEFFGEFNLTLDRLQVVCGIDGVAIGDVYLEFDSVEDARIAISKDGKMIQSNHVQLLPSSPDEASRAIAESR
ncbi:unnamed protein product [Rhodiola kirilowii]